MVSTQSKNIPILDSERDWLPWSEYIFIIADEYGVKRYINPDILDPGLPVAPVRPTPEMIKPGVPGINGEPRPTTYSDLDANEREQLRWMNVEYDDDKRIYRKHTEAIAKVRMEIQRTVAIRHFIYTRGETTHAVMVKLRDRFKQTDHARMMELHATWTSLTKSTKVINTDEWLQKWETTYDECLELNIPDVQGNWPVLHFLNTLKQISPSFAESYSVKQAEGAELDFRSVLKVYRTWHRNTHINATRQPGRGSVYTTDTPATPPTTPAPTLNGKDKGGKKRGCLCGSSEHPWSKCPHIFEWNRPTGFKIDDSIQKLIEEKKSKNSGIATTLQGIRDKYNNQSKTGQSPSSTKTETHCLWAAQLSLLNPTQLMGCISLYVTAISWIPELRNTCVITDQGLLNSPQQQKMTSLLQAITQSKSRVMGQSRSPWECEGTPDGKRPWLLYNVKFIPTFTTNTVSYNRFFDKQIY
ncbi:hypothetical protein DL98DRAFT_593049 [Cadophora sp. DSE1049]|nr:hypothetical protein DL98DRAFT_593049 [Cadophora sp. DSE1049]